MKKFLTVLAIVTLTVVFTASGALAYSFSFSGGFELRDDNMDGFAEVVNFNANSTPWFPPFSDRSPINMYDPDTDPVLSAGAYVLLSEFTLDHTPGGPYSFTNNPYYDGFEVWSFGDPLDLADDVLLLQADITLDPIKIDGSTASINASFGMNLTDIEVFVPSPILDAFVAPGVPGGAVNFTFNVPADQLKAMIEAGGGEGSYSASAAPVPEPGTLLLLGAGLIGLIGLGRKFNKK